MVVPLHSESHERKRRKGWFVTVMLRSWQKVGALFVCAGAFALLVVFCPRARVGISEYSESGADATPEDMLSNAFPPVPLPSGEETINLHINQTVGVDIQFASDLHLEFYRDYDSIPDTIIIPRSPVLALLGDIGYACTPLLRKFLYRQADRFQVVLVLAGNHEYYNSGSPNLEECPHRGDRAHFVQEQFEWMRRVSAQRSNLYFVDRQVVKINGITILPTTLWSHIPPETQEVAERGLNDYHKSYIPASNALEAEAVRMTADFTSRWHAASLAWLEEQLAVSSYPVVVLTHHTPRLDGTSNPRYNGNPLTACFSSDLRYLLRKPVIHTWACGHTHYNFDRSAPPEAHLISNQRGYPGQEKPDYRADGIVIHVSPLEK